MNVEEIYQNLSELNFTAIDFETANEKRNSPCSLGIVVVRNGVIVQENYFLIKPKELRFTEINYRIHGLTEVDVENELEFDKFWERNSDLFQNKIILAHNAEFDIDVLRQTLAAYNLPFPLLKFLCTQKLAQEAFTDLKNYRLSDVAEYIKFELNHHNSLSDARAAAAIGIRTIPVINKIQYSFEEEGLTHHIAKKVSADKKNSFGFNGKHIDKNLLKPNLENANPNNPFYNRKVVFTGDLKSISRSDAAGKIQLLGADINVSISKQTQIVIIGQKAGPVKLRKIEELNASGCEIKVINEEEFLKIINY